MIVFFSPTPSHLYLPIAAVIDPNWNIKKAETMWPLAAKNFMLIRFGHTDLDVVVIAFPTSRHLKPGSVLMTAAAVAFGDGAHVRSRFS